MTQAQPPQAGPAGSRPGAMTMAMQAVQAAPQGGPKVLRIGLIQGGKIVEERIVRKRETVTVGGSEKNHFIIQAPTLPPRFELFQLVGNDYILNFTPDMKGRVGLPGGVMDLDQLRAGGGARNAGTHFQVKLSDSSRGKVVVGDVTLLFQFVVPPPVQPRPQLPAAVVGGFVAGIDWPFTSFLVFMFMLFFGFVIYLESADWPIDQDIGAVPEALSQLLFEEPTPPPTPVEATEVTEEVADEVAEEAATTSGQSSGGGQAGAGDSRGELSADQRARIAEEAGAQAEAMILGALSGESGAFANVLAGGAATGNAEDVLAQAAGVGVAQGGGASLRTQTGGGGSGQGGGLGSLRAAGGGDATAARSEGGQVVERVIRGNVRFDSGDEVGGAGFFDQSQVTSMIQSRRAAFRRCYETALRNNPSLSGKVTVQFTIQPTGTVSRASAVENTSGDPTLASCVVSVVQRLRWREGPDGGSVDFAYPFVFAPQN